MLRYHVQIKRGREARPRFRELRAFLPDDVQVVTEIPHTATGKINKLKLRESFKDYKLPTA